MNALAPLSLAALVTLAACHAAHHTPPPAAPLTEAAIAVPIAPGKTAAWQAALEDLLGPRYAEYDASRRRYGLTSQTTFLQRTPMGDFAVIHLTGEVAHRRALEERRTGDVSVAAARRVVLGVARAERNLRAPPGAAVLPGAIGTAIAASVSGAAGGGVWCAA